MSSEIFSQRFVLAKFIKRLPFPCLGIFKFWCIGHQVSTLQTIKFVSVQTNFITLFGNLQLINISDATTIFVTVQMILA